MYQNRKFNPDQDDIDKGDATYPTNDNPDATPIQLVGSVYGAERDDLTFKQQGKYIFSYTGILLYSGLLLIGASDVACCILICLFAVIAGFLEEK